ncbi:MAG: hypothetical protein AAF907_12730, partial [Planctomycetota bacterium]
RKELSMSRDLMAPNTEPTDEELHAVMVAARNAAMRRREKARAWTTARLAEAESAIVADRRRRLGADERHASMQTVE